MKVEYNWHASYKTVDGYSKYEELKVTTREEAIKEAALLPGFKKLYEIFRRGKGETNDG